MIQSAAEEAEIGWRTVEHAAKEIGVVKKQHDGGWTWELPEGKVQPHHAYKGGLEL
jgi:hypothetical protein